MILNPGENFTVVRQLQDPSDVGTYYVQAIIRNALTDAILATFNLTDKGRQRFSKAWQVAADPVGLGYYVDIETRVYTDADYTVLSDNYGQINTTFLVDNRFRSLNAGGGSSGDVDYKKIRKIFKEVLGEFEFNFPTLADIGKVFKGGLNFGEILDSVRGVARQATGIGAAVARVEARKDPELNVDLKPVLSAIEGLPRFEKADFTPVLEAVEGLKSVVEGDGGLSGLKSTAEAFIKVLESGDLKKAADSVPTMAADIAKIEGNLKDFLYILETRGAKKGPEEPAKPDYAKMAEGMIRTPIKRL